MPAGPAVGGFGYFLLIKWIGYSAFCGIAIPRFSSVESQTSLSLTQDRKIETTTLPNPLKAGLIRTAIGLAVGCAIGIPFYAVLPTWLDKYSSLLFFAVLVPVRVGEWALLLKLLYKNATIKARWTLISTGILTSFALDAIGVMAAFVLPGGAWVC